MSAVPSITKEQAKLLLQVNLKNLAQKISAGETLTARELAMVSNAANAPEDVSAEATVDTHVTTQTELAKVLGVNRKTIERWMKEPGHPVTKANGRYDVAAWRAFKRTRNGDLEDVGEGDEVNAKARQILLQNEKLEFQIKVLKKEYVSAKDVEEWTGDMILRAKSVLLSGPASLAPQVVGLSIAEAEKLIRQWLHDALANLSAEPMPTEGGDHE